MAIFNWSPCGNLFVFFFIFEISKDSIHASCHTECSEQQHYCSMSVFFSLKAACWATERERERVCVIPFISFALWTAAICNYIKNSHTIIWHAFYFNPHSLFVLVHADCAHSLNVCANIQMWQCTHTHTRAQTKTGETDTVRFEYAFLFDANVWVKCTSSKYSSACDLCYFPYGSSVKMCMYASVFSWENVNRKAQMWPKRSNFLPIFKSIATKHRHVYKYVCAFLVWKTQHDTHSNTIKYQQPE